MNNPTAECTSIIFLKKPKHKSPQERVHKMQGANLKVSKSNPGVTW